MSESTSFAGNAPEFYDKPKIIQRDNGNVIAIKARGKSHLEVKAEWFKVTLGLNTFQEIPG